MRWNAATVGPSIGSPSDVDVGPRGPLWIEPFERQFGERHRLGAAAGGRLEARQAACDVRGLVTSGVLLDERDAHGGTV